MGEIEKEICCTWDSIGSVRHGLGRFDGSFDGEVPESGESGVSGPL